MHDTLAQKLSQLPDRPGCYTYRDVDGKVLYVGKAESLRSRVRSYFQDSAAHSNRIRLMVERIADFDILVTDTDAEALLLECNLIKRHRPVFNVRLRDDKHYPYICLTMDEPFPRPIVVRRVLKDGRRYFGPYTSSQAMRQALRLIKSVFKLRGCSRTIEEGDTQRLCLDYHIGLCDGPCAGLVKRIEYLKAVDEVTQFLRGNAGRALELLEQEMSAQAEQLNFEAAARLRDQIRAIQQVVERQKVLSPGLEEQDVIAIEANAYQSCASVLQIRAGRLVGEDYFFLEGAEADDLGVALRQFLLQYYERTPSIPRRVLAPELLENRDEMEGFLRARAGYRVEVTHPQRGDKRRLLELASANARQHLEERRSQLVEDQAKAEESVYGLQDELGLETIPHRIECYDISNTQGSEIVGAMVVFEGGRPKKSDYRRFKIKSVEGPNDFASMREMLRRRIARSASGDTRFGELPDLMVIDGGKGQLGIAVEVLAETSVELEVIGLAKRLEEVFVPGRSESILLPRNSSGLFLLQRIRDEAHRFGLTYHRSIRGKRQTHSALDDIPGVGPKRRLALLKAFGSVDKIRDASPAELAGAPGMNATVAAQVHAALQRT